MQKIENEVYEDAIYLWKNKMLQKRPELKIEDIRLYMPSNTVINVNGNNVCLGMKLQKLRTQYKKGELSTDDILFWENHGIIWNLKEYEEYLYKKAAIQFKENFQKNHPDVPKEKIRLYMDLNHIEIVDGFEVTIGAKIRFLRTKYTNLKERKEVDERFILTQEEYCEWTNLGMIWINNEYEEYLYRTAAINYCDCIHKNNPDIPYECIKLVNIPHNYKIVVDGIEVNLCDKINNLKRTYQKIDLSNEKQVNYFKEWENLGLVLDYDEYMDNIYKKAALKWKEEVQLKNPDLEFNDIKLLIPYDEIVYVDGMPINIGTRICSMRRNFKINPNYYSSEFIESWNRIGMIWIYQDGKKYKLQREDNKKKIDGLIKYLENNSISNQKVDKYYREMMRSIRKGNFKDITEEQRNKLVTLGALKGRSENTYDRCEAFVSDLTSFLQKYNRFPRFSVTNITCEDDKIEKVLGDKFRCYIRNNCTYKLSIEQVERINNFGCNIQYIDNNIKYMYNGEELNLLSISNKLNISIYCLYDSLLKTKSSLYPNGSIDKAILMTLELKNKNKRKKFLSKIDGVDNLTKYFNLNDKQIERLLTSNFVKNYKDNNYQFQYQGKNLRNFCLENHINYSVIIYAVETSVRLGLDLDLAIEDALKNYNYSGQKQPTVWTYERYGVLYKHEMLNLGIDYMKIINKLKKYDLSYDEALSEQIFCTNMQGYEWLYNTYNNIIENGPSLNDIINEKKLKKLRCDAIYKLSGNSEDEQVKDKIKMLTSLNQQSIIRNFIYCNFNNLHLTEDEVKVLCKSLEIYYEAKIVERNHFIYSKLNDNISIEEKLQIVYHYDLSRLDLFKAYYQMLRFDNKVLYGNEELLYKRKIDLFEFTVAWNTISEQDKKIIISQYNITLNEIEDIIRINNEIDNIITYSFEHLK